LTAALNAINAPRDAAIFLSSASNSFAAENFPPQIFADAKNPCEMRLSCTTRARIANLEQRELPRVRRRSAAAKSRRDRQESAPKNFF
jgi:hypothetical protein